MTGQCTERVRNLVVVLGDQLGDKQPPLAQLDARQDLVWMAEVRGEATHVRSHRARIALFLSAMRHFRDRLTNRGLRVRYRALDSHPHASLGAALAEDLARLRPQCVQLLRGGDWRAHQEISTTVTAAGVTLELREDSSFLIEPGVFEDWLGRRRQPRMEHFYRFMRRRHRVLMDNNQPAGGSWNYDARNRRSFDRRGPGLLPAPPVFQPDTTTREVLRLVQREFPHHPGDLDRFSWPVTPEEAQSLLRHFIDRRLPLFGPFQDAMWDGEPFLYHSLLASALNLKQLDPRAALGQTEQAWREGHAPIESAEGFVRQILGWREYVRGIYWNRMPDYLQQNALDARQPLPGFFWSGDTDMTCLRTVIGQTLQYGYAHHIQRLMVTGLFCLLLGVDPKAVHEWYLAVYVDAVEWVELPNTLGMSQYADGGWLASKPYVASGRYISRMSNYCDGCRFDPGKATGADACPFTTLYWDFLQRHRARFERHPRTALQWKHLRRIDQRELERIRAAAETLRRRLA
jgi:deoxyribodipyrimidine photolyase-related protein